MRNDTNQARYENAMTVLTADDLLLVSGGGDRTCSGPTVCDEGGYCEDAQGVCKMKAE